MLTRIRAPLGAACGVLAVFLGGCSQTATTGSTVSGSTLTVYARAIPGDPVSQDVIAAERLAWTQAGEQVGHFRIAFKVVSAGKVSDSARTAITDSTTIAYLGEETPHDSADSMGITNGLGILQVSPTDTALELTQKTPAVSGSPNRYYGNLSTYHRTFARVIPASSKEAGVLVKVMGQQHVNKLYVTDDTSLYGKSIAYQVIADAKSAGITVDRAVPEAPDAAKINASGADAVFDGADVGGIARTAALFSAVAASEPQVGLYASSPMAVSSFATALSPAAQRTTLISSPGVLDSALNQAGQTFVTDFTATNHHKPDASAIFGYVAMGAILQAVRAAGPDATSRALVVKEFFAIKNLPTALGTLSINASTGDVQELGDVAGLAPYVISRIRGGKVVAFEAEQG